MVESLSLIIGKEEQLVLFDRSAQGYSKHVVAKLVLRQSIQIVLPAVGVQYIVAEKFVSVAMKRVGSRLDRHVYDSSLEGAELRRRVLRDQVEFLDGIHARTVTNHVVRYLVVVHPV